MTAREAGRAWADLIWRRSELRRHYSFPGSQMGARRRYREAVPSATLDQSKIGGHEVIAAARERWHELQAAERGEEG